jgi:Co/Zn/Cd efflux system component
MNADAAAGDAERPEARAFRVAIFAIAGGIFLFAAAETAFAFAIGNRQLVADGVDWIYDVALYALAAAVFGRGRKAEDIAAMLIAAIMFAAGCATLYDLWDKIVDPRPIEPFVLGFSAVSAFIVGVLAAAALWRFRHSGNSLITATWLSSRNDAIKQIFSSALSFSTRGYPERWPEYALDLFSALLAFQAAWAVVAQERRKRAERVGADARSE